MKKLCLGLSVCMPHMCGCPPIPEVDTECPELASHQVLADWYECWEGTQVQYKHSKHHSLLSHLSNPCCCALMGKPKGGLGNSKLATWMELLWRTKGDAEGSVEESKEFQFFVPQYSGVPAAFLPPRSISLHICAGCSASLGS